MGKYFRAPMLIRPSHPIVLVAFILPSLCFSQRMSDAEAVERMQAEVRYLASEELEGREAGTPGERKAADFIAAEFARLGLKPKGNAGSYLQEFTFLADPVNGPGNYLQIGRRTFKAGEEFYFPSYSARGVARGTIYKVLYGIHAPELGYDDFGDVDLKGRVAAMAIGSPDGIHPHSKYLDHHDLRGRVEEAIKRGAVGVLLYNDDPNVENPERRLSAKVSPVSVPVVFLDSDAYQEMLMDNNPCVITADIVREERTAYNVIGLLDNGRNTSTVVGAHFDHLGWGDEGSLHRGDPAIHYGADDNASGTSVMMQLARDLVAMDTARSSDHLFIAFSGEEKGLYGSNYWTKNATVPLEEINYMINLDMVGRLDSTGSIGINGVGTSPSWSKVDSVTAGSLLVRSTVSGIGASDHTSFYLKDIPAIHFFTGTHGDYHKPGDTWDKVNFEGMLRVTRFIEELMIGLDGRGPLAFSRTEDADSTSTPRFKVTLGVVPDYMYSGKGMRIDGVTEGKPAANAGLKEGDVVVRLGPVEVIDMMAYMKGLAQYGKGDSAPVVVLRDGKELKVDVTF